MDEPWYTPPGAAAMGSGKVGLSVLLSLGTMVLGLWAAVVTYAGPAYGFAIDSAGAWQQTTHRALLHLVPGAGSAFLGLLLLIALPALRQGRARFIGTVAALGVMAAGIWLVIGRSLWAAYTGNAAVDTVGGGLRWAFELRLVHEWGPGLLLLAFGAWSLGLQAVGRGRPSGE
jgi:hypothetical protein